MGQEHDQVSAALPVVQRHSAKRTRGLGPARTWVDTAEENQLAAMQAAVEAIQSAEVEIAEIKHLDALYMEENRKGAKGRQTQHARLVKAEDMIAHLLCASSSVNSASPVALVEEAAALPPLPTQASKAVDTVAQVHTHTGYGGHPGGIEGGSRDRGCARSRLGGGC